MKFYTIITATTCIIGSYLLFNMNKEMQTSNAKINLEHYSVQSQIPDDIALSNNVTLLDTIKINETKLFNDTEYQEELDRVQFAYSLLTSNITSDFIVDIFTSTKDSFSVTKIVDPTNTKTAIYLSGNNDYFYNSQFARQIHNKGYNFYAISFPNNGFTSNVDDSNFSYFDNMEHLFQYIEIVLQHYKIDKINILFGHSAGGLIAIMYSNYKNSNTHFVDRLILSSPFLDWYADPASTSVLGSEEFIEQIITPLGLILPKINLKSAKGKPNYTSCQEFNERAFNPKYKSLVETNTYPAWMRAVTLSQQKIQNKEIDTRCKVDIFCSDKSVHWKYSNDADNTLDVEDIQKYGMHISKTVQIHTIKNSIHTCFLRINIDDFI